MNLRRVRRIGFCQVARLCAVMACLALAVQALGQPSNPNAYRLDLSLVLRSVSGNTLTDVQTGGTVNAVVGQTYRIEVRYRINDGDLTDNLGSRGLTSANIIVSGAPVAKGLLSPDQGARAFFGTPVSAAPANPDTTAMANGVTLGLTELGAGVVSGMMDPFRGGVGADNNAFANGTTVSGGWSTLPLSLSSPGQNSFTGLVANNNNNTTRWGIYAFNFTYNGGIVTLTAEAAADPQTGNRFSFWYGGTTPANSQSSTPGTITFVSSVRACCGPMGTCTAVEPAQCVSPNILLAMNACGPTAQCPVEIGACCMPDLTCATTLIADCIGLFAANSVCSPSLCVPGACCTASGCTLTLPTFCAGTFFGVGTSCQPLPCAQACCLTNFACLIGLPGDCVLAGGTPSGQLTCTPLLCCPTPQFSMVASSVPFNPPMGASLSVQVSFPGMVTYQWRKGGVALMSSSRVTGVNSATLMFAQTQADDAGMYDCVVTASCGRVATSPAIAFELCSLPSVGVSQTSVTATAGQATSLSVTATGLGTLAYQWRKSGVNLTDDTRITGSTTTTLMVMNVMPSDQAVYDCVVTSTPCGTSQSAAIALNVQCSDLATDCNGNNVCDVFELAGMNDIGAATPTADSFFGWAVAASEGTVAIGERFAAVGNADDAGRVHVYQAMGQAANLVTSLTASDVQANAQFGFSVSVSGDWLAASAHKATSGGQVEAGAVYVFRRVAGAWTFFQRLSESVPVAGAQFGHSVSVKGDRLLVGTFRGTGVGPLTGNAYVYRFNGINWGVESPLSAPDGAFGDGFGIAVAIDDPYLIVSAPYDTDGNTTSGSAYIYFRSVSGWQLQSKVRPRVAQAGVPIGEVVSISGDLAIVSSVLEDVGGLQDAGAAYVFRRTDTRWTQQRRLTAANPVASGRFGYGLSVQGNALVVGEFTRLVQGFEWAGSFDVFYRRGNFWTRAAQVNSPRPEGFARFGYGLALDNGLIIASAFSGSQSGLSQAGWARVFSLGALDCNANSKPDVCDIAQGVVVDVNGNGIPDGCEATQCRADFNDSGVVSIQDIFDFLTDWFASNLTADFNDSNVISIQDIFDFLVAWFAGC